MRIPIVKDVLQYNKEHAETNRSLFNKEKVLVINLLSSPGAGKTSIILRTISMLKEKYNIAVIEGDISSTHDAEKIKRQIENVVQINTGGTCHLNASMVEKAIRQIELAAIDVLFIENVGNLICPVGFDLGEDFKVLISSVNEGDDKPVKYPNIFIKSDLIVLNKIDMLDFSDFELSFFEQRIEDLKGESGIIKVSAKDGSGLEEWAGWITSRIKSS
jgi:hydrogenase nickel incorporation protein HypB